MTLRIPAKVLIHVWSYDFYDMTLSTGKLRRHMIKYMYLIVSLVFSHLGFWSGSLFLIAPFPDLCLLVLFYLWRISSFRVVVMTRQPIL